jgi:hypothetical protein
MPGGEELVVRAPCPCVNVARKGYLRSQPACVGIPDLDGAILSSGSHARTARAKSHRPDGGFVPLDNIEFPSGDCLPDMNRSVLAIPSQLSAVRAPAEPPGPGP